MYMKVHVGLINKGSLQAGCGHQSSQNEDADSWWRTAEGGSRITAPDGPSHAQIPAPTARLHLPLVGSWVSLTQPGDVIAITAVLSHQPAAR